MLSAAVCGALLLAGCFSWRPLGAELTPGVGSRLPYHLRVTRDDGSRVQLLAPFVKADTLFGRVGRDTVGVSLDEVQDLKRERLSPIRTLAAAVGAAVLVGGGLYLVHCGWGGRHHDLTSTGSVSAG